MADSSLKRLFLINLPQADSSARSGPGKDPKPIIEALLEEASALLQPVLKSLEDAMLQQVRSAALPQFAAIPGMPALYRMRNKPVPSQPSPYVDLALRPIIGLSEAVRSIAP